MQKYTLGTIERKKKNEKRNIKSKYVRKKNGKTDKNSNNIIYIGIKIEFWKKKYHNCTKFYL